MIKLTSLIVLFTLGLYACEKDSEKYITKNKSNLLKVTIFADNIEADGTSTLTLFAFLQLNADNRSVTFTTTKGVFTNNDSSIYHTSAIMSNGSLFAVADLKAGLDTNASVQVKISVTQVDTIVKIRFVTALPDSISNESAVASIPKGFGSEVPLITTLLRKIGVPSKHQFASFHAIKLSGEAIGDFRSISPSGSNENGIINSVFVLRDTVYTGPVRIISRCHGRNGLLTDTITVHVLQ